MIEYYKEKVKELKRNCPEKFVETKVDNGKMINANDILKYKWEFAQAMNMDLIRSVRKDLREKVYKAKCKKPAAT